MQEEFRLGSRCVVNSVPLRQLLAVKAADLVQQLPKPFELTGLLVVDNLAVE